MQKFLRVRFYFARCRQRRRSVGCTLIAVSLPLPALFTCASLLLTSIVLRCSYNRKRRKLSRAKSQLSKINFQHSTAQSLNSIQSVQVHFSDYRSRNEKHAADINTSSGCQCFYREKKKSIEVCKKTKKN